MFILPAIYNEESIIIITDPASPKDITVQNTPSNT